MMQTSKGKKRFFTIEGLHQWGKKGKDNMDEGEIEERMTREKRGIADLHGCNRKCLSSP